MKKIISIILIMIMALSMANAEAVGYTKKKVIKQEITYLNKNKTEHCALVESWYSDGTRGTSCGWGQHWYNRWGKCACGAVNLQAFYEGLKANMPEALRDRLNSNGIDTLYGISIEYTAITKPIYYINTNEAISGQFVVTDPCYTAPYSANLIAEYGANFTQMKYWGIDEYGNVTYEFIDEETGAVTFAHEGGFEVLDGNIDGLDKSVENATPAEAIEAASTTERIFVTTKELLYGSTVKHTIANDYDGELIFVEGDEPVLFDNHGGRGDYVMIDEDDVDKEDYIYVIESPEV